MGISDLYNEYFDDVYRYILSLTKNRTLTEDIVQETFTRAYLNLGNYENSPNKAWLFTVGRNLYYDYLRKNKRIIDKDYDFTTIAEMGESPDEKLFKKENIQKIHEEVENLQGNYRNAIIYYYLKEFSYKEAANSMNVTVTNFKSILFRAKKKLKRSLNGKGVNLEE